jgi:arylsulfatase A-like enzyme
MRYMGWLAGTLAVLALAACRPKAPPNVFLIVIDTLRADRVGWYGDQRGLTPFLDSLAEGGTVFWNACAQSSWTKPSVATIFTSRSNSLG